MAKVALLHGLEGLGDFTLPARAIGLYKTHPVTSAAIGSFGVFLALQRGLPLWARIAGGVIAAGEISWSAISLFSSTTSVKGK